MARRARAFAAWAALSLLTACGDPGSAVDGPPPKAVGVEGAPAALGAAGAGQGRTLAAVRARGYLVCGVQWTAPVFCPACRAPTGAGWR